MEGVREEVGKKPSFRILYALDIADQTQGRSISHASHHGVQADGLELIHEGLGSDPVIAQKHHGFPAALMADIHHFLRDLRHFSALERLEVLKLLRGNPVLVVVIALVDDIFRTERIARFLLKLLQDIGAYGRGIAVPFHIFFPGQLVEHQRELMEEGGEAQHVYIRMVLDEFTQAIPDRRPSKACW